MAFYGRPADAVQILKPMAETSVAALGLLAEAQLQSGEIEGQLRTAGSADAVETSGRVDNSDSSGSEASSSSEVPRGMVPIRFGSAASEIRIPAATPPETAPTPVGNRPSQASGE